MELRSGTYVVLSDGRIGQVKAVNGFHADVVVFAKPTANQRSVDPATMIEIISVVITALGLLSDLIPAAETLWAELKRLWLLVFGSKEQKAAVKQYRAFRAIAKDVA